MTEIGQKYYRILKDLNCLIAFFTQVKDLYLEHKDVAIQKFNYICGDGFRWLFISCSIIQLITVKNNIIKDVKLRAHESNDPYVMSILKENLNMLLELYETITEVLDKSGLKLLENDIIRKDLMNEKEIHFKNNISNQILKIDKNEEFEISRPYDICGLHDDILFGRDLRNQKLLSKWHRKYPDLIL